MPRNRSPVLTDHELRLMEVLWQSGKATVAEVTAEVGTPPLAYNTVLSTLRTLEQKGYVAHEEDG
jgi:predicted transcriptional regulator